MGIFSTLLSTGMDFTSSVPGGGGGYGNMNRTSLAYNAIHFHLAGSR